MAVHLNLTPANPSK